jgi:hypothetical protein
VLYGRMRRDDAPPGQEYVRPRLATQRHRCKGFSVCSASLAGFQSLRRTYGGEVFSCGLCDFAVGR